MSLYTDPTVDLVSSRLLIGAGTPQLVSFPLRCFVVYTQLAKTPQLLTVVTCQCMCTELRANHWFRVQVFILKEQKTTLNKLFSNIAPATIIFGLIPV